MPLLSVRDLAKSYGARPLFEGLALAVEPGERLGLIGPNGAGKSTLLRILAGLETPDHGERTVARDCSLAVVAQVDAFPAGATAVQAAAAPLIARGVDEHEAHTGAEVALRAHGFADPAAIVDTFSGGWRKRLALVRGLLAAPDLLLLDEPTNHLDPEARWWLEGVLAKARFACVMVSHDRWFLERVATRVVEIDPRHQDGVFSAAGGYRAFLARRDEHMSGLAAQRDALANQVRRETEWLAKQPKARTVKAEFRVRDAERLQAELADANRRANLPRSAGIEFSATGRRANALLTATGLAAAVPGRTLFAGVDLELPPGARLGILGLNGSGKSTLLRILSGERAPDAGGVKRIQDLRTVVFHQDRSRLRKDQTLRHALCPNGDTVRYRNQSIHVVGWAKRLLFRPDQLDERVGDLSGGEQARILLGLLMLEPADLLILDEPTNDLDIPALEVLEESLLDFPGAVVLVTHDRFLLDRVSTRLLALDGQGGAEYVPDYAGWERREEQRLARERAPAPPAAPKPPPRKPVGLSSKERRELDGMEAAIGRAEAAVAAVEAEVGDPAVAADGDRLHDACERLAAAQQAVERLYARWQELEAKAAG